MFCFNTVFLLLMRVGVPGNGRWAGFMQAEAPVIWLPLLQHLELFDCASHWGHRGGLSQPGADFLLVFFFALLCNHEVYLFSLFFSSSSSLQLGIGELVPCSASQFCSPCATRGSFSLSKQDFRLRRDRAPRSSHRWLERAGAEEKGC